MTITLHELHLRRVSERAREIHEQNLRQLQREIRLTHEHNVKLAEPKPQPQTHKVDLRA